MRAEGIVDEGAVSGGGSLYQPLYDRIGVFASSLCAVHCILMPWVIMAMPIVAGTFFTNPAVENIFVGISISLAAFCGYRGCRRHGKWFIMVPFILGSIVLFGARLTAPAICCLDDISWSHASASAFGGMLLASSHYLNIKYSRLLAPGEKAPCCHSESCEAHEEGG